MKKCILTLCLILMAVLSQAAERTSQQAAQLAAQFTNSKPASGQKYLTARSTANMILAHTFNCIDKLTKKTKPAVYAFNRDNNQGFVLVSADDQTRDILCYSDEGSFDLATANPDFLWWINRYAQEVANVDSTNAYTGGSAIKMASSTTAISPLLGKIAWDQGTPYWNKCPSDDSGQCYTGCVATAAAQIMRFWKYPAQGTDSHSYTWNNQTLSCDFSTITFDWDNMLETYSGSYTDAQADAVANLMYACGVACDMSYTSSGSGSYTDYMGYGLITYFDYNSSTAKFLSAYSQRDYGSCRMSNAAWSQTTDNFTSAFNTELEAGRPILMGGSDTSNQGGHEFVCDGRDADGNFHINWGWAGNCNCYCALSALKPTGQSYDFSSGIDAVIGIKPNTPVAVTGVSVDPTAATININGTQQLTATVAPTDATTQTVTWSSSNEKVATVDATGLVTGIAAGTATITATTNDGGYTATSTIKVNNKKEPGKYTITFNTGYNTISSITSSTTKSDVVSAGADYISGFTSNCSNAYYQGTYGVKLGKSSKSGTFEFTLANDYQANIKSITVKSVKYGSDTGTLTLSANSTELESGITPGTDYTYTYDTPTTVSTIKLATSKKHAYISEIVITTETPEPTDVNGDWKTDTEDVTNVATSILHPESGSTTNADVNSDNKVDIIDITKIIQSMIGEPVESVK